jgi:2,4-dienoyl-CoA reductase-like NADH-dependent reductase (Old Yellow Enzyme family)
LPNRTIPVKPTTPLIFARNNKTVRNRTVLAAMTNKQSNENGTLSEEEIIWLERRAQGGFGITTTAAANVTEHGRGWQGEMGVWGDHQLPGLKEMAKRLRAANTLSLVQLFHGGMRAPQAINGVQPISASANTEPSMDGIVTKGMSHVEILSMIASFTDAAVRCEKAGFDGVELHGAHSYLISQFLGSKTNRRDDQWGGDINGRSQFLQQIITSIRKKTSENFIVGVRISPIISQIGICLKDSLELTRILCSMDIDFIHISCWDVFQKIDGDELGPSLTKRFHIQMPKDIPLISTGAVWSTKDAQWLLDEGADFIGVARVAIGHPEWPSHLDDNEYSPQRPPFTVQHLLDADLSHKFVDYMKRWKNFVIDE